MSHQVAKVLEFSFSISPSNEYSGMMSFRMDWLDLLAVQRTLKSFHQCYSSKEDGNLISGSSAFSKTSLNKGISELKKNGMGEFNSDDLYIYYCGQESLRRN